MWHVWTRRRGIHVKDNYLSEEEARSPLVTSQPWCRYCEAQNTSFYINDNCGWEGMAIPWSCTTAVQPNRRIGKTLRDYVLRLVDTTPRSSTLHRTPNSTKCYRTLSLSGTCFENMWYGNSDKRR